VSTVLDGIDGDEVREAQGALLYWGGDPGPRGEEAVARALHAVEGLRARRAYEARRAERTHAAAARQLRVDADLREARQRVAAHVGTAGRRDGR